MYNYTECPVCKSNAFKPFLICTDHTVSKERFAIVSCESCSFTFTNPIPDKDNLGDYYKSEDYISHSNTRKGIISQLYHLVRNYTLQQKIKLISNYVSRGTILDYGSGTGMFLETCRNAGWKTYGMEPDPGARKFAADRGLEVYESKIHLPTVKYTAISLWHVLEHVTDLDETLGFFKNNLEKDGVLIIAVPNYTSYDASYYREYWAAYDVPRHLYHFEKKTMVQLLSGYGFELAETKAMKFDSFYVSMLSEKYKTGRINYFNAFRTGLKSNLRAKLPENYSSVIYVFKMNQG